MEKTPEEIFAEKMAAKIEESKGQITAEVKAMIEDHAKGNAEKMAELEETAKKQGEAISEMLKKQVEPEEFVPVRKAVRNALDAAFKDKSSAEIRSAVKSNITLEIKTAGTYLANTNATGSVQRITLSPEWDAAPLAPVFLPTLVPEVNISDSVERVVELYNRDGDAAFTAEGVTAPLVDFDNKTTDYSSKIVDAMTRVSEKALNDIDLLEDAIMSDLMSKIAIKQQQKVFAGTGTDEPNGVNTVASAYVLTGISTTDPNNQDAIIAAAAQVSTLFHTPTFALVNEIDYTNMKLEKDKDGRPIIPRDRPDMAPIRVVTTPDANVMPVGYVLVGDASKIKHRLYKPLAITFGYDKDGDFGKGIISIKGLKEIIAYVPAQNQNAFVYDSFANIKSAITEITA